MIDPETFSDKIKQEIDCVGCVDSLHTYLRELAQIAKIQKNGELFFGGLVIYPDGTIGEEF